MAGSPTPPLIQEAFGSGAGSAYITNPIPVASQISVKAGAASYTDGFPPLTMTSPASGGVNPYGQDVNGILFAATANIAALTGGQQYTFNSTYATANGGYALGAILGMANGAGFWLNQTAGNSNDPDTTAAATSGWVPLASYGVTTVSGLTNANITLSAVQAAMPVITLAGTLTGNVQIIFPTWMRRWLVVNNTTGAYSLTCKTASGTGIIVPQFGAAAPYELYGDGANIQLVGTGVATGTFTPTYDIGWSVNPPNVTAVYSVANGMATISIPAAQGTSNSVLFIIGGVPISLRPNAATNVTCPALLDNGAYTTGGTCTVATNGQLQFFPGNVGNFTASGSKGFNLTTTFSYPLTA